MTADAVVQALRTASAADELLSCPREASFKTIYQVLGDASAILRIRNASPDRPHCSFLLDSPTACCSLPFAAPPLDIGDACPNNPYLKPENEDALEEAQHVVAIVDRTIELSQMAKLQMLTADGISPSEFTAINALERYKNLREHEAVEDSKWRGSMRSNE